MTEQPPPPRPQGPREKMREAIVDVMHDVAEKKQALKEESQHDLLRRRQKEQRRWLWLFLAAVALAISITLNLPRWRHPFLPPTGAAAERDARRAVLLAEGLVERYRVATGVLPLTLSETGVNLPGVVYRQSQGGYELSVTVEGQPIVFHSGDDPARFRSAVR